MTESDDNLWARRPRGRHADLYDAEYAKQLERIARIRSDVSASIPGSDDARGTAAGDVWSGGPERRDPQADTPAGHGSSGGPRAPEGETAARGGATRDPGGPPRRSGARPARWDAPPVDLAPERPVVPPVRQPRVVREPDEAPVRRRRRAWLVLAGAVVLTVLAGVAAFLLAHDPEPAAAATVFHVGGQPTGLAVDAGRVWVAGPAAGRVWVLDQRSGRLVKPPLRFGGTPARLALGPRFAWIADTERSSVVRVPVQGDGTRREIRTGPDLSDVAFAAGRVWTASSADGTVRVLDRRGRSEVLRVGARPIALAGDARRVVVLDAVGALVRLDATTRREEGPPVQLGGQPVDVALAGDTAWVADHRAGSVREVILTSGLAGLPISVGRDPVAIAADGRDVYVVCRADRTLVRLSPEGVVRSRRSLESAPTALALDPRHVWIAAGTDEVIRVDR
jgi:streptogramin lyase